MANEYWKWPVSNWLSDQIDWKSASRIIAGVDIGTTSTQAAILCDGKLFGYANLYTGADFKNTANAALEQAIGTSGLTVEEFAEIAVTGFGSRNAVYATKTIDEIHAIAKGARYLFDPSVTTVVDLGGQTMKAIRLFDWDRIRDFKLGDKCATGMGRSVEIMAGLLHIPIEEIGKKSLAAEKDPEPVSTTCFAFANTETIGLFRQGYKEDVYTESDVLASFLFAIAWRTLGTIGKLQPLDIGDIKVYGNLAFTGGLAKNVGVTKRIERELGVSALSSEIDPQLAGAIGAALLA